MLPLTVFDPTDTVKYPGGVGVINVGAADAGSKLLLYNESQINFRIDFYNGSQTRLHAWEARYWTLDGDTKEVSWIIESVLNQPSPPISLVMGELYGPNEHVEGTYPISLVRQASTSGTVTTVGNTVSNEGTAAGTEVVDIGTAANPKLWDIFNDHFVISMEIAGVKHTIFVASLTGNPLQIGQAGDIAEILGNLSVDGSTALDNGNITTDGAGGVTLKGASFASGVTSKPKLSNDGAGNLNIDVPAGTRIAQVNASGIDLTSIGTHNLTAQNIIAKGGKLGVSADGDLIDAASATATFIKARNAGSIQFQTPNGTSQVTIDASGLTFPAGNGWKGASGDVMARNGHFSGTGSGTYGHTLGVNPTYVIPIVNQVGSATQGWDSGTSTQVHITLGSALSFNGLCFATS